MSLKRGILFTFLTQAPTLLLFFGASLIMTRLLGDVGRGEYALLTNNAALLTMLFGLNLGFAIIYYTSRSDIEARASIGTAASLLLLNLALVPIVLLVISGSADLSPFLLPDGRTHWGYLGYIYLTVMLGLVNIAISSVLLGLKKFKPLNGLSLLNAGLSATGFALLYLFRHRVPAHDMLPAVLSVTSAALVLQSCVSIALYVHHVRIAPWPIRSWSTLRPILAFSLVAHLSHLVNLINYRFDVWVVDNYHGAAELGLYAVAVGVGQLLFYIPDPLTRVVQPFLFGQVKDEMLERYKAIARLNFTAVLALSIVLCAAAYWIVPLLFGEVFSASVLPLQLLLPGIVCSASAKLLSTLVVHGGLQRFSLYATIVGAVLTITLDLLLIPRWGIEGAAVASTVSYAAILVVVLLVIRYRLHIPVHDLFLPRSADIRLLRNYGSWKSSPPAQ